MSIAPPFMGNLVGVSFRPKIVKSFIELLQPGMNLIVDRQYDNAWDDNAVRVFLEVPQEGAEKYGLLDIKEPWADGRLFIGYIEKGIAAFMAPHMDEGWHYAAQIKSATGDPKSPWLIEMTPTEKGEPITVGVHLPEDDTLF